MINLLPPDYKEQLQFSKYNVIMVRYVLLVLLVATSMSVILLGTSFIANDRVTDLNKQISEQELLVSDFDAVIKKAKEIETEINKAGAIIKAESNFYEFLGELELGVPNYAKIASINMNHTSNSKSSSAASEAILQALFRVPSSSRVAELQTTLLDMERVAQVDVQSISRDEDSGEFIIDTILLLTARPGDLLPTVEDESS